MSRQWHQLNNIQAICTSLQKHFISQIFTGRMSFLTSNQQRQSTEETGKRVNMKNNKKNEASRKGKHTNTQITHIHTCSDKIDKGIKGTLNLLPCLLRPRRPHGVRDSSRKWPLNHMWRRGKRYLICVMRVVPAEALEGVKEHVRCQAVFTLQQMHLFQSHGHRRPIFGTLTASKPRAVHPPTHLHHPITHGVPKKKYKCRCDKLAMVKQH